MSEKKYLCKNCGTRFYRPLAKGKPPVFCSKTCFFPFITAQKKEAEIQSLCKHCEKPFSRGHDHGKSPIFCSRECAFQFKAAKKIDCKRCGKTFPVYQNGKNNVFCSIECRNAEKPVYEHKECEICKNVFYAGFSANSTGVRIFCSVECTNEWRKKRVEIPCEFCSNLFYPVSDDRRFCSKGCSGQVNRMVAHHAWTGGRYINEDGFVLVRFAARSVRLEHRIVAEEFLGEKLRRTQRMLHIDGNRQNNSLDNLYVCDSQTEHTRICNGRLPWPKSSNLLALKMGAVK